MEKELSDSDYNKIYERAVQDFIQTSVTYKTKYERFLTKCVIDSFLGFLKANNLEVKEGKIYVATSKEN